MIGPMTAIQVMADYDGGGHMSWGGGWWIVMVIAMVMFWGLLAYWLIREFGARKDQSRATDSDHPLTILDRRLAEGSITTDEYRERRAILTGNDSSSSDSS